MNNLKGIPMTRYFLLTLTFITLFVLSGCGIKETTLKPQTYTLEPIVKLNRFQNPTNDVLKVARIDATSNLNTRAILYKKDGALLPYKYGIWSETPPLKLQHLITEALQDQNHFAAVVSGTSMASNNLVLEPILQHFEEVFKEDGTSYILVTLRARLVEVKSGMVLGSKKFSQQKEVTNTNGAQGVVEAFDMATSEIIQELSTWVSSLR